MIETRSQITARLRENLGSLTGITNEAAMKLAMWRERLHKYEAEGGCDIDTMIMFRDEGESLIAQLEIMKQCFAAVQDALKLCGG